MIRTLYRRLIEDRYGTHRGLVRLWLALIEWRLGRLRAFDNPDLARVDRFVHICLGNICRSPYSALLSEQKAMPTASFGLSTTTGARANAQARECAVRQGRDLEDHRATDMSDFEIRDGDLLLVMEVRQARRLQRELGDSKAQIALLGVWATPARPHIHDPLHMTPGYFDRCYQVIESAVDGLHRSWSQAREKP